MTPRGRDTTRGRTPTEESEGIKRPIPPALILAVVALVHLAIALPALNPAPHNGGDAAMSSKWIFGGMTLRAKRGAEAARRPATAMPWAAVRHGDATITIAKTAIETGR